MCNLQGPCRLFTPDRQQHQGHKLRRLDLDASACSLMKARDCRWPGCPVWNESLDLSGMDHTDRYHKEHIDDILSCSTRLHRRLAPCAD